MFNVSVNDKKNIYRSKPVMNVDTVPKPLTYDYMPEGYPSKSIEYVTLMEEQEVTFYDIDSGLMEAFSPVALDTKLGDKLTVVWDGVSYDVVVKELVTHGPGGNMVEIMFGNLSLINKGESEDYPFVYCGLSAPVDEFHWVTADTAASHTIKVMRQQVKYTPIDVNYMPEGYPSKSVQTTTLAEEAEVTFSESGSNMRAQTATLDIEAGDKLTIIWDGVSYNATVKRVKSGSLEALVFGNLGLANLGDTEDYPFVCGITDSAMVWTTADTATSHTIGIVRQRATYAPIDIKYMPKNLNVVFTGIKYSYEQQIPTSCNVTYDELRRLAESDVPIFAIYKFDVSGVPTCKIITQYKINAADSEGNTEMVFYYQQDGGTQEFVYSSAGIAVNLS